MSEFNLFGTQKSYEDAKMVIMPVSWELTTSYSRGTYHGPRAIEQASSQIDFFDFDLGEFWQQGIHLLDSNPDIFEMHRLGDPLARELIDCFNSGKELDSNQLDKLEAVNKACEEMVSIVRETATGIIDDKGFMGLIGGDHSTPLGLIQAIGSAHNGEFGILHIDAHADLRQAYMGFKHSHASIMYNVLTGPHAPKKLVQVGIRDFCAEEFTITQNDERVKTFFDTHLKEQMFAGRTWQEICDEIIGQLPEKVYVSFDIDGMSPEFCPHTGTPVPGGLNFDQVNYLLKRLGESDKKMVGFDLVEVAPGLENLDEWDGNVGSRVLYKLCGWQMKSKN